MRKLLLLFGVLCSLHATALTLSMPPPGEDIVGEVVTVKVADYEHTINTYAEAYGVGFRQLVAANPGVNPWVPGAGTELVLPLQFILPPGEREGIVINLAEMRMYHYQPDGGTVETYPIGIGREGWETPLVAGAKVIGVIKDPRGCRRPRSARITWPWGTVCRRWCRRVRTTRWARGRCS